ncbi:hypothetical protein MIR68_004950 [Amoeboaphelidium protococcarum]|nr:hypothetical protein MIR68_004950 [Amoeboaphelidium protococcarum]
MSTTNDSMDDFMATYLSQQSSVKASSPQMKQCEVKQQQQQPSQQTPMAPQRNQSHNGQNINILNPAMENNQTKHDQVCNLLAMNIKFYVQHPDTITFGMDTRGECLAGDDKDSTNDTASESTNSERRNSQMATLQVQDADIATVEIFDTVNYRMTCRDTVKNVLRCTGVDLYNYDVFGLYECAFVEEKQREMSLKLGDEYQTPQKQRKYSTVTRRRILRLVHPDEYPLIAYHNWRFAPTTTEMPRRRKSSATSKNTAANSESSSKSKRRDKAVLKKREFHFLIKELSLEDMNILQMIKRGISFSVIEPTAFEQIKIQQYAGYAMEKLETRLKLIEREQNKQESAVKEKYLQQITWISDTFIERA